MSPQTRRSAPRTPAGSPARRERAPDALAGRYRAREGAHDVYIVRLTSLRWQVLDVTPTDVVIIDTLAGYDDRFEQARARLRA